MSSTVTAWVEVVPVRSSWDASRVHRAKISKVLKRRPNKPTPDSHLIEVTITVPDEVFGHRVRVEL